MPAVCTPHINNSWCNHIVNARPANTGSLEQHQEKGKIHLQKTVKTLPTLTPPYLHPNSSDGGVVSRLCTIRATEQGRPKAPALRFTWQNGAIPVFFRTFANCFMLFNSIAFLIFLPIVFSIYSLLHKRLQWPTAFVVAPSYLFYVW